ncbi:MAG: SDR family NAD(P)-dependent oxidoreductase, partial [Allopontixanthobacter sediminis]
AGSSVYSATKFGVRAITEALDGEWAEDGIKSRSLMPSFIDTPLLKHAPNAATNQAIETIVRDAGLEITPVLEVAQAAWDAVHGEKLHTTVGKTAKQLAFGSRWMPERLRRQMKNSRRPLVAR